MQVIHSLRLIASFSLLGAVVFGSLTGWIEHQPVDFRAIGAILGALTAIGAKAYHAI